jgi:methionyl aminopeptidase
MFKRARLKTEDDISRIRDACGIISAIFSQIKTFDLQGMNAFEVDSFIESRIMKMKGRPAFKTVRGYGYASCISVNDEVVHGLPVKKKIFKKGDLVKIDIGVALNGFFGDSCYTFNAGELSPRADRIRSGAYDCLMKGISAVKEGARVGDIGFAVKNEADRHGCSVVTRFSGHGVGFALHEPPVVPNIGRKGAGQKLSRGIVIAIEPMINEGAPDVKILDDGWTAVTADGSLSAQFEHTVAVTEAGCEILTSFP